MRMQKESRIAEESRRVASGECSRFEWATIAPTGRKGETTRVIEWGKESEAGRGVQMRKKRKQRIAGDGREPE